MPAGRSLRRAHEGGWWHPKLQLLLGWVNMQWHPAGGGRLLLLATGVLTTLTAPLIQPDAHSWRVLAGVGAAMTALLLASFLVPWTRLPRSATLAFPVAVWGALAVLGPAAHGLGANFTGMIVLGFAYIGLTQSTATALKMILPAMVAYVLAYNGWSTALAGRLPIALAIWVILAVVLAGLVERQAVLTDKLLTAAHTDALTGVANRRDLEHRLSTARSGDTLVMCDLDNFKRLNDVRGHAAGDRVLAEFGMVLLACLREEDYAARYGGEEFALLLRDTDRTQARATLQRLRSKWASLQPDVTFSTGFAVRGPGRTGVETLEAADRALYSAKAAGRDRDRDESAASTGATQSAGRVAVTAQ